MKLAGKSVSDVRSRLSSTRSRVGYRPREQVIDVCRYFLTQSSFILNTKVLNLILRFDPEAGAPRRLGGVVTVDVDTGLQPELGNTQTTLVEKEVRLFSSKILANNNFQEFRRL